MVLRVVVCDGSDIQLGKVIVLFRWRTVLKLRCRGYLCLVSTEVEVFGT